MKSMLLVIKRPTREELFACTYAQYLSFWAMLYFKVCAVYWAEGKYYLK